MQHSSGQKDPKDRVAFACVGQLRCCKFAERISSSFYYAVIIMVLPVLVCSSEKLIGDGKIPDVLRTEQQQHAYAHIIREREE